MTIHNNSQKLDFLIENNASFAIFRLPNATAPQFLMQSKGEPEIIQDFEQISGKNGFVIAPFRISEGTPIIMIRPDCTNLDEIKSSDLFTLDRIEKEKIDNIDRNGYDKLFHRFFKPLSDAALKKIVLSRSKTITKSRSFSPGEAFYKAMSKYKHAYVYLINTPICGTWLGSSPEMLLSGSRNVWQTVALAGTRYPNKDNVSWDDKNLREQHLVTSYILNQLATFKITPQINGPYTTKAANLAHLRTDIVFKLTETNNLGNLIKSLHPTPAVSGLPKEEAYRYIEEHEGYNRKYYTGFLGMIDLDNETNIYVNIRCMEIGKSLLTLFSGSGLVLSSTSRDEWKETEQKLKTMASIVN